MARRPAVAMSQGRVLVERSGAAAWITISNPDKRNAMSLGMWRQLDAAVATLADDPGLRVVVLRGAGGKAFVSGADISEFATLRVSSEVARAYDAAGRQAMNRLRALPMPTVAMIDGFCLGGGVLIALCCDLRYAATDAVFSIPAARVGLGYDWWAVKDLLDAVGISAAKEMLFVASGYSAESARSIGLVNRVIAPERLLTEVTDIVARIASTDTDCDWVVFSESIAPVVDAGLVDLVETSAVICDEVRLLPTPGHTPNHVSVKISSRGQEALITGDFIHHSCQMARPHWWTVFDDSPNDGVATRRRMLESLADTPTLVIGTHFPTPTAGRVAAANDVDARRIAVAGQSAGGGLAAALTLLARDRDEFSIRFQFLDAPMIDDRTCVVSNPHPFTGEFTWTPAANHFGWTALLGHAPGQEGVSCYAAAARATDLSRLPPAFIVVGALDLFLEENLDYARRLTRHGVPTELHVIPGAYHGFARTPGAVVSVMAQKLGLDAMRRAIRA